jgi:hypothetical protein
VKWGGSKSAIKNYENREFEKEVTNEGAEFVFYLGENNDVNKVVYVLQSNQLEVDYVWLNNTKDIDKRLKAFIEANYEYVGKDEDGDPWYISSDEKTAVGLWYEDSWTVCYIDADEVFEKSQPSSKEIKMRNRIFVSEK